MHQNQAMTAMLDRGTAAAPLVAAVNETVRALSQVQGVGAGGRSPPSAFVRSVETECGDYQVRGSLLRDGWRRREPGMVVSVRRLAPPLPSEMTMREVFRLTEREARVATLLARGRSNGEIARALGVSPHTARHHTESVLLKLGVHSRAGVKTTLFARGSGAETSCYPPPERWTERQLATATA